ncbi:MAG: TenA family transcriptional regulator [Myxococcota bacterium]
MKEFAKSRLATDAGELWDLATRAEFLDAVRDGSLPEDVFNRWLVQDYLFVRSFAAFASLTVAKTPRPGQSVLIAGLSALDEELDWFEAHARTRSLDLNCELHPACQRYRDFLIAAGYSEPFQVLLAIFYGVEVAYAVAWGSLEAQGPYAEFINRWTHADFQAYVRTLLSLADQYPHPRQQARFNEVMRHEQDFWRMAWEG